MKQLIIAIIFALTFIANAQDANLVARVIVSEAGPECSIKERVLVASVIKNRIGHKGFANGKLKSMLEVVKQKNAFECIGHDKNKNWKWSANPQNYWHNKSWRLAWRNASALAKGKFHYRNDVHFFVTKGFKIPKGFVSKKYWNLEKVVSTEHFDFYLITAK